VVVIKLEILNGSKLLKNVFMITSVLLLLSLLVASNVALGCCELQCYEDADCPCPADSCMDKDWYDYPDYGKCLCDQTCDTSTECGAPCAPTVYENDERCVTPTTTTTTTTTTSTTTTTTSTTTTTTIPEEPTTTTTTTIPEEPTTTTTTTTVPPKKPAGGGIGIIRSCELNGVCDYWETPQMCPSDCKEEPTTTTTTKPPEQPPVGEIPTGAVCGNDECEEGEDLLNCPEDCLRITVTTTTQPSVFGSITGMLTALTESFIILLIILLILIALVLGLVRFKVLPRI